MRHAVACVAAALLLSACAAPPQSWGDRVTAAVRPNIIFVEDVTGNPRAEVDVWVASDGYILSVALAKSSGVESWDRAVVRALQKTERLPLDADGRIPSRVRLTFQPKAGGGR